jgi:hypothetical protein
VWLPPPPAPGEEAPRDSEDTQLAVETIVDDMLAGLELLGISRARAACLIATVACGKVLSDG